MPKKIIIDTDPGVDDAMAILFAFASPEVEVVGLTSIFGNVHADLGAQNALRLVEFAGRPEVPVAEGAALPLIVPLSYVADFVHGTDGLGNTYQPLPQGQALAQPAAQFITEMIMAHPGEITLVPIGPLTNLALAVALELGAELLRASLLHTHAHLLPRYPFVKSRGGSKDRMWDRRVCRSGLLVFPLGTLRRAPTY
jgi:uridine nucleosidase